MPWVAASSKCRGSMPYATRCCSIAHETRVSSRRCSQLAAILSGCVLSSRLASGRRKAESLAKREPTHHMARRLPPVAAMVFSACPCSVLPALRRRRRRRVRTGRAVTAAAAAVTNRPCGQFRFRRVCLAVARAIHSPSATDGCSGRRASQRARPEAGRNVSDL